MPTRFSSDDLERIRELLQKRRDGNDENAESALWREFTLPVDEAILSPATKSVQRMLTAGP